MSTDYSDALKFEITVKTKETPDDHIKGDDLMPDSDMIAYTGVDEPSHNHMVHCKPTNEPAFHTKDMNIACTRGGSIRTNDYKMETIKDVTENAETNSRLKDRVDGS